MISEKTTLLKGLIKKKEIKRHPHCYFSLIIRLFLKLKAQILNHHFLCESKQ